MEVSGVVFRQIPCFSGVGFDTHSSKSCFSGLSFLGSGDSSVSVRTRMFHGVSNCGFSDHGHLEYYVSPRCGTKKKKEKKNPEIATIKKKLKLIKGLSRDLSMFSSIGFGFKIEDGLIGEVKEKKVSEAAEVLMAQLQQLRAEEKEMKRKKKEEKARIKATRTRTGVDCESSSSNSSESSDNECGEVVKMSHLRSRDVAEPSVEEPKEAVLAEVTSTSPSLLIPEHKMVQVDRIEDCNLLNSVQQDCCTGSSTSCGSGGHSAMVGASGERIEVCMGGKCKKSGAGALLDEFEKRVSTEGAVVGCRCMGKCRQGPNVRILNQSDDHLMERLDGSVGSSTNPLCIGVGLEDVDLIVSNFFGKQRNDLGLVAT